MLLLKSVISLCEEVKKYHHKKGCEHPGFLQESVHVLEKLSSFHKVPIYFKEKHEINIKLIFEKPSCVKVSIIIKEGMWVDEWTL